MNNAMRQLFLRRLIVLVCCAMPLPGIAAPITEAPTLSPPIQSTPVGSEVPSVRLGAPNGDTRTIDLLVEMQQPGAGVQFNERSARSAAADQRARAAISAAGLTRAGSPAAAMEAPLMPPSGLFGSGATPAVQARPPGGHSPLGRDGYAPPTAARSSSAVAPELASWLQWPRDVMAYLRDNRAFVVGCVAVLLLLAWSGSWVFGRRRG